MLDAPPKPPSLFEVAGERVVVRTDGAKSDIAAIFFYALAALPPALAFLKKHMSNSIVNLV